MTCAFIIRPFGKKKDSSGTEVDFEHVQRELIDPALQAAGISGGTTGKIVDAGNIREDMFALIIGADIVVCDITILNANVFYELGIRHALRKKSTVMIKGQPTKDTTPFDILTDKYLEYDINNPGATKDKLTKMLTASLNSEREMDSPVFKMLPNLSEADPSSAQSVPGDFREEVDRARKANSKGWLRLLSEEVRGLCFRWGGLKLVAKAQWDLNDSEGARLSWEIIHDIYPDDVDANLALANIYERMYRRRLHAELIEASDQAINRVVDGKKASRKQRVEAGALAGRNRKTRWRLQFDNLQTTEERRTAAMNRDLIKSYEEYRKAFLQDLNHFYSGLAALQMGTILMDLSGGAAWADAFESDAEADSYKQRLVDEIKNLRYIVPTSVTAELQRIDRNDPERFWAEISAADLLFVTPEEREKRVVTAYRDALPLDKPFAWDATKGQLELFASLGIKTELAEKIIKDISPRYKLKDLTKPVQLFISAGHRIDAPGRVPPRFPSELTVQDKARSILRDTVKNLLDENFETEGLASAAPGADILAHEVFTELGLKSTICLPMPAKEYARQAFESLDDWRARFIDLQQNHTVIELSDKAGLPRWLSGSTMDAWERGNRWVMQMAQTWGAKRIILVVLWDGKESGDTPGGTAHMVQLARNEGSIKIVTVDANQLLSS
jgi:hypothetical protein